MTNDLDMMKLIEIAKWKKNSPDEYKEVMQSIKEIVKDLYQITKEIQEEM